MIKVKNINARFYFIRENIKKRELQLKYVKSQDQIEVWKFYKIKS